jgi:hypothetical protein
MKSPEKFTFRGFSFCKLFCRITTIKIKKSPAGFKLQGFFNAFNDEYREIL